MSEIHWNGIINAHPDKKITYDKHKLEKKTPKTLKIKIS